MRSGDASVKWRMVDGWTSLQSRFYSVMRGKPGKLSAGLETGKGSVPSVAVLPFNLKIFL